MTTTTEASPVTWEQLKAWLAAHGAPTERVRSVSIVARGGSGGVMHLRVEHCALDANGKMFAVRDGSKSEAATDVTWVPLLHLP